MRVDFDPATLELTFSLEGDAPRTAAVEELSLEAGAPAGPFTPEQWQRILSGERVTVRLPAGVE
jgi:hypothetical protein